MSQITGPATVGPGSGTVTSITAAGGLTAVPNPITTAGTISIDQTNLTVLDGTVYWDTGTQRLNTTATGTANFVLTSNGAGSPPTYQAVSASGAVTSVSGGNNITITGTATAPIVNVSGTTNHSVLLGNATNSINSLANGTTGQVLHAVTGANDPIWGAVSLTADVSGILPIANGGTNASSMTTTDGTVYFDGTRLVTTATGTANFVLTSGGPGVAPTYQAVSASGAVTSVTAGLNIAITGTATAPIVSESQDQYLTNYRVANASPFVVNATDFYITVDTSTIPITIQLPNAPTIYRRFVIKDSAGNAAAQNVTVTTVGGVKLIDGAATFVMNTNYQAIELVYDNFGYQIF